MTTKYLGIAVAITGRVFAHPCDGSPVAAAAHDAAIARGDYPYTHLYEGDDILSLVAEMRQEQGAAQPEGEQA